MKYMTKDWYNTMQKSHLFGILQVDKKSGKFSEEYFQKLYEMKKEETIKIFKHQSKKKSIKKFEEIFKYQLSRIKKLLPMEILNEVKDIRVLALGHVTKDIYQKITEYSENIEKYTKKKIQDYNEHLTKQFKDKIPDFAKEYFHDCFIKKATKKNNDFIIKLNNKKGLTQVTSIVFKDFEIVKQESNLKDRIWLYEEVYKLNNQYEYHVLLRNGESLEDFIIKCSNIELKYN